MTRRTDRPVLDTSTVESSVSAARLAPSILNCQPWRFHATPERIDVFVVPDRAPTLLDTTGREVYLSLGAAVLNLRLALGAAGVAATVEPVPSQLDPHLAATVRVGGRTELTADERAAFDAIPTRRTSRLPFADELVPYEDFDRLQEAAAVEGAHLQAATGLHLKVVSGAIREADRVQRDDTELVDDASLWTLHRNGREDVGIPTELLGPRPSDPTALVRDFAFGQPTADRPTADFEKSALVAVLLTSGDGRADWLRGGMALERVLLAAAARGLSVGLLSQPTEVSDLRRLVRDPMTKWRHPQIVLRIGYGETPPPTPRLPLGEVLEVDPSVAAG
jgi:nitroreductase